MVSLPTVDYENLFKDQYSDSKFVSYAKIQKL